MSTTEEIIQRLEIAGFKRVMQDAEKSHNLILELIELSEEAAKILVQVGGMLNKDLAYDITKKISQIKKLEKKYA